MGLGWVVNVEEPLTYAILSNLATRKKGDNILSDMKMVISYFDDMIQLLDPRQ